LKGWPPRLISQVLSLGRLNGDTAVNDLNQAPVLYISGKDAPTLTDDHVAWLREYVDEGGFIFAVANCSGGTFDEGFRDLIVRMFPDGDASLQRLQADHPVYRSEYLLKKTDSIELYGVDFGCRTAIIYSPEDLGCLHRPESTNHSCQPHWHQCAGLGDRTRASCQTQQWRGQEQEATLPHSTRPD